MRFIASCGLALVFLFGTAFAQEPTPTAPPNPAPNPAVDCGLRIGGATCQRQSSQSVGQSVGQNVGQNVGSNVCLDVSERERILLERIDRLERRVNELESRSDSAATAAGIAAMPVAPSQTTAAASQQRPMPQPNQISRLPLPPHAAWDKDGVKIIPFGILIANLNYNTSSLDSGSIVGFANPDIPTNTPDFDISPGNTFLGVDIHWPKIGKWEINGKVDFDLRGPTPLRANNLFAPLFIHVYGEAKTERYRLMAGQAEDLVSPLISNSLNTYPFSFVPGKLGFFRPQARFETYQPIGDDFTFSFKGAIAQSIQTFQVANEVIGDQTGLPDGQMRLALGYGKPDLNDPYQRRPFEVGVSGHLGQRRGTQLSAPLATQDFTSWSADVDLSFKIGRKLRLDVEYFKGSVLGDYAGGIFQTFNPVRLVSIRSVGAWAQLSYNISDKWQVNVAYGRDDPYNRDLAIGQRSLNYSGFGNFYYKITPRLWVATEFSRWTTTWVGRPTGRAFRVEPAVLFFF